MSSKRGEERIKGFSSTVKKAEETNNWTWWGLFGTVVIMGVMFILKRFGKI